MRATRLAPLFVESIPDVIEEGVLYLSLTFDTATHRCACGCGGEVVTPLSPTDWKLYFDGENVSLEPSIGNWSFRCRSHYWLKAGNIRWSGSVSAAEIQSGRVHDTHRKSRFYQRDLPSPLTLPDVIATEHVEAAVTTQWEEVRTVNA